MVSAFLFVFVYTERMARRFLVMVCLLLIVGAWFVGGAEGKVVFLNVGQGDSILLQDGTAQVLTCGTQHHCQQYNLRLSERYQ